MDIGLETVDKLFELLDVDPRWAVRFDRGFTWWIGAVAQTIWAEETQISVQEGPKARLFVRTDIFRNFDSSEEQAWYLGTAIRPILSGFARRPDDPTRVGLVSSAYVTEGREWFARNFAAIAAFQATDARIFVETVFEPEEDSADIDRTAHPESGARTDWDAITDRYEKMGPTNFGPSQFAPAMDELPNYMEDFYTVVTERRATDCTIEFPFGGQTCEALFDVAERHPFFGYGVFTRLALPVRDMTSMDALRLMEAELREPNYVDVLGDWAVERSGVLSFRAGFPNILCYHPEYLGSIAVYTQERARLTSRILCGDDWAGGGFEKACDWRFRPGDDAEIARHFYDEFPADEDLTEDLAAFRFQAGMFEIPYDVLKGALLFTVLQLLIEGKESEIMPRICKRYPDLPGLTATSFDFEILSEVFGTLADPDRMDVLDSGRWSFALQSAPKGNLPMMLALSRSIFGRVGRGIDRFESVAAVAWNIHREYIDLRIERARFRQSVENVDRMTPQYLRWMQKALERPAEPENEPFTPLFHLLMEHARLSHVTIDHVVKEAYENLCRRNARFMTNGALWYQSAERFRYCVAETLLFLSSRRLVDGQLTPGKEPSESDIHSLIDEVAERFKNGLTLDLAKSIPGLTHGEMADLNAWFMFSALTSVARPIPPPEPVEPPPPKTPLPDWLVAEREVAAHFYDAAAVRGTYTSTLEMFQEEAGMLQISYQDLKGILFVESMRQFQERGSEETLTLMSSLYPNLPDPNDLGFDSELIYKALLGEDGPGQKLLAHMEGLPLEPCEAQELSRLACRQIGSAIAGNLEDTFHLACLFISEEQIAELVTISSCGISWHLPPHLAWLRSSRHYTPERLREGLIPMQKMIGTLIHPEDQPDLHNLANHMLFGLYEEVRNWPEGFWYNDPPRLRRAIVATTARLMEDSYRKLVKRELPDDLPFPAGHIGQTVDEAVSALERRVLVEWGVDITTSHANQTRGEIVERDTYFFYSALLSAILEPKWLKASPPEASAVQPAKARVRVSEAPKSRLNPQPQFPTVVATSKPPPPPKKGFFARWLKK